MRRKRYWILVCLAMFIVLPVLLSAILLLPTVFAPNEFGLVAIPLFLLLVYLIYLFGKKATLPDTFLARYGPFLAPILFTLVIWLVVAFGNGGDFLSRDEPINYVLFVFLPFFAFSLVAVLSGAFWLLPMASIAAYLFFTACFAVGTWRSKRLRTTENKKALPALALILVLALAATVQGRVQYDSVLHSDPKHPELRDGLWGNYTPFQSGTELISPKTPPSLQINRDYPRLDGAEALIPVYAAAANAIYRNHEAWRDSGSGQEDPRGKAVRFSKGTPAAYQALLQGDADMIFTAAPSEEQKQQAAAMGLSTTLTPIGREAFVFLVNERNPVTGLGVAQIRDIYSGKINDWKDVGGAPGKIMAFQRNKGSGSQTAMLRVMHGTAMRPPLKTEYAVGMIGLLRGVAGYRNLDNAIGYSFRYYATVMNSIPGIRLLAVDGVAPTVENIRNGSYPFTADFYIVSARPLSANAAKLRDWFLSDEGQQFIAEVGYVPLPRQNRDRSSSPP